MDEVVVDIHFDEEYELKIEDAKATVYGLFNRNNVDLSLLDKNNYPRAHDTQEKQIDVLVGVEDQENPVRYAQTELQRQLASGAGAPAHRVIGRPA